MQDEKTDLPVISGHDHVDLLIFAIGGGNGFFVIGELPEVEPASSGTRAQGFRHRVKTAVKAAYNELRKRFDYQENVCAHLRHASTLCLVHSPRLSPDEAQARTRRFIQERIQKHRKWLIVDSVLALFGSLLTPLPGPNIFFFYPAARALSHYFAYKGTMKVSAVFPLRTKEDSRLKSVEENMQNLDAVEAEVQDLECTYNINRLRMLLEKS